MDDRELSLGYKSQHWCFTWNNYTSDYREKLENLNSSYLVAGKEIGKQKETPHIQGYVYFKSQKRWITLRKIIPNAYWKPKYPKSTPQQCRAYCTKDENFIETGKIPPAPRQGKRNDLNTITKTYVENPRTKIKSLVLNGTINNLQQLKFAEAIGKYLEPKRDWVPTVYWFWGPPECGKSLEAHQMAKELSENEDDIYEAMSTGKWWDGYDGQSIVICDDTRKDFLKFHELLKLLDRYAYRVETKGSTRQMLAKYIFITTPLHPEEMYNSQENIYQLIRRITEIREYKPEDLPKIKSKYNL